MTTTCTIKGLELVRSTESGSFTLKIDAMVLQAANPAQRKIPIMGRSGAGKSTLLNALASMAWQKDGGIQWEFPHAGKSFGWSGNQPLPVRDAHELRRRHFGFMFQNSSLLPYCSIGDNLIYPQMMIGKRHPEAKLRALELLRQAFHDPDKPDYAESLFSRFIHQISGGERQRVALVQAMVNDPSVLFADEPAGSLDHDTRQTIMSLLFAWAEAREDRLLLWVTHHQNDPREANVKRYLHVDDNRCEWRELT